MGKGVGGSRDRGSRDLVEGDKLEKLFENIVHKNAK
jgi:hypothetical protein